MLHQKTITNDKRQCTVIYVHIYTLILRSSIVSYGNNLHTLQAKEIRLLAKN